MVACGRVQSDRRAEIVKLFGMLRADDIFPSAVTLGQYTKAIAEGFSKRTGITDDSATTTVDPQSATIAEYLLRGNIHALDSNLLLLEEAGRGWRRPRTKSLSHQNSYLMEIF